jgi:hypothetical protein
MSLTSVHDRFSDQESTHQSVLMEEAEYKTQLIQSRVLL